MITIVQDAVNRAVRWGRNCGLSFSSTKTVVVVYTLGRLNTDVLQKVKINGETIKYSSSAKYLGVTFDTRLNFRDHVKERCAKATRMLMAANKALRKI